MLTLTGRTKKALAEVEVEDAEGKRQWRKLDCRRLLYPGLTAEVLEGGVLAPTGLVEWLPGNIDEKALEERTVSDGRVWVPGTALEEDQPHESLTGEEKDQLVALAKSGQVDLEAHPLNKADADELELRMAETADLMTSAPDGCIHGGHDPEED